MLSSGRSRNVFCSFLSFQRATECILGALFQRYVHILSGFEETTRRVRERRAHGQPPVGAKVRRILGYLFISWSIFRDSLSLRAYLRGESAGARRGAASRAASTVGTTLETVYGTLYSEREKGHDSRQASNGTSSRPSPASSRPPSRRPRPRTHEKIYTPPPEARRYTYIFGKHVCGTGGPRRHARAVPADRPRRVPGARGRRDARRAEQLRAAVTTSSL